MLGEATRHMLPHLPGVTFMQTGPKESRKIALLPIAVHIFWSFSNGMARTIPNPNFWFSYANVKYP